MFSSCTTPPVGGGGNGIRRRARPSFFFFFGCCFQRLPPVDSKEDTLAWLLSHGLDSPTSVMAAMFPSEERCPLREATVRRFSSLVPPPAPPASTSGGFGERLWPTVSKRRFPSGVRLLLCTAAGEGVATSGEGGVVG